MSIVAIDFGLKRCGLAVVSTGLSTVLPDSTVARAKLIPRIQELHQEDPITLVVLGYPLSIKGHGNEMTLAVDAVQKEIQGLGFEVVLFDERHTTNQALQSLRNSGFDGYRQRRAKDEMAAVQILNEYLQHAKSQDSAVFSPILSDLV